MRAILITRTVSLADTETPLEKAELPVPVRALVELELGTIRGAKVLRVA